MLTIRLSPDTIRTAKLALSNRIANAKRNAPKYDHAQCPDDAAYWATEHERAQAALDELARELQTADAHQTDGTR